MAPLRRSAKLLVEGLPGVDGKSALQCVDAATGQSLWTVTKHSRSPYGLSALCGDVALFHRSNWSDRLEAYSIEDGRLRWTAPDVRPGLPGAVTDGHLIFIDDGIEGRVELCAVHGTSGAVAWRRGYGGVIEVCALLHGHLVLTVQDDKGDAAWVVAVSREDGHELWRVTAPDIAGGPLEGPRSGVSQVSVDGDSLFVRLLDGTIAALDVSGSTKWQWRAGVADSTAPIVSEGYAMFTNAGSFVRLDAATGAEAHRSPLPESRWPGPTLGFIAGAHYLYADGDRVIALDWRSGKVAWEWPANANCAPPIVVDGCVLVASADGFVQALG